MSIGEIVLLLVLGGMLIFALLLAVSIARSTEDEIAKDSDD